MSRAAIAVAILLAVLLLAGCGVDEEESRPNARATLLLDFTPNAVHAGIYSAVQRGYDAAEGVHLRVREPSSSTDAIKLLLAGRTDFAVLDIHDVAIAAGQGRNVACVMSIAQRPLASVLANADVRRPRDLEGRTVGVTGLPSDDAVLRSIVEGDGGDPGAVDVVTIGFNAVPALLSGRVDGATAFWDVEGVALRQERPDAREFRLDEYGAPAYPELLLCTRRATVQDHPALVRATVDALQRGYRFALDDPESSVADMLEAVKGASREQLTAQMDVLTSVFLGPTGRPGALDERVLRRWARWEAAVGIVDRPPEIFDLFVTRYANGGD
ncbi:MAG TPA: ABC transporter substrate-binding protein [Capillimicrobium sp.]|nr:ABC transporter substrate-binding protein [Capillimicrobium sp.]